MLRHHHLILDTFAFGRSLLGWLLKKFLPGRSEIPTSTHSSAAETSSDEALGLLQYQGQTSYWCY